MSYHRCTQILVAIVCLAAPLSSAQARAFNPSPTTSAMRIDGRLDEPVWADATVIPIETEWSPGDNTPAPVQTECRVAYDDAHLYVSFRALDPDPSAIRAHYRDRDSGKTDDTVGFLLDTFNDGRRAFQFRVNPLGVQLDAVNSDIDDSEDFSWDAIWDSAGRIDEAGYVVEVSIPFSQLRFSRTDEPQTWGFLATRHYPRSSRHRLRSEVQDRSQDCFVCQFGELRGLEGIRPGLNMEITPTLTAGRTDRRDGPGDPLQEADSSVDAGLSARWNLAPNAALDVAVNPDFSQVEADNAQLEINTRFALFFPEKRPFFLEGADFFGTLLPAVFTRTVADPKAGVKLTGKEGIHSGGVFYARDEINNLIFPGYDGSGLASVDQEVDSGVLRYRVDVGSGSNLGAVYTGRQADDYSNQVGGVDGTWRPWSSETIRFQGLHSVTEYPEEVVEDIGQPEGSFTGNAAAASYSHSSANWFWGASYSDLSRGFRADSGFVTRVNTRRTRVDLQHLIRGQDTWFSQLGFAAGSDWTQSQHGGIRENGQDVSVSYLGPNQMFLQLQVSPNDEHFDGEDYDNTRLSALFEMRPSGEVGLGLFVSGGGTIDAANSREAGFVGLEPGLELSLGRRARADLTHEYQRVTAAGDRLFSANLSQASLLYHLNLRTFFRLIVQYRHLDRNASNYLAEVEPVSKRLFTQWFFSFKLNPNTVVLAGYSDTLVGTRDAALATDERSFFVKLGYSFVP